MDLIEAVIHNNASAVETLLQSGADPNFCQDIANITPLHFAAQHNSIEVVQLLLTAGANIHARTVPDGHTPFDIARLHKHQAMCDLLQKFTQQIP